MAARSMNPLAQISTRHLPQTVQADPRQVENNAGGFTFEVTLETRLRRFLTIGTEGGSYYVGETALTKDNAQVVLNAAEHNTRLLVDLAVEISVAGRAPKNDQAIFAIAAASALGDVEGRRYALDAVSKVCRTGTHLFQFAAFREQFGGWGRGTRRAVAGWYESKDADALAYQMVKYRQRDGWSQRDLLRLAHPNASSPAHAGLYDWVCKRDADGVTPALIGWFEAAQAATKPAQWNDIIYSAADAGARLSWEMLPDAARKEHTVWRTLLDTQSLPLGALLRQLPTLTRLDALTGEHKRMVRDLLGNEQAIKAARIHPIKVLLALKTYALGRSERGTTSWTPDRHIVDALDAMFYKAFGNVEPTGKRTLLALDVSGSMQASAGGLPLSCREVVAAMALVTLATEPHCEVVGFTNRGWKTDGANRWSGWGSYASTIEKLDITPRRRLDDVVNYTAGLPMGGTDCALPMLWAEAHGHVFDTISVWTDNETWAGSVHPHQALKQYRQRVNAQARFAVVAVTPTRFSIADPADAGSLDISGFDSAVPQILADFSRGVL